MKTVCMVMMVKNEGHVIGRCLASAIGQVNYLYVSDTGSTDNTIDVIEQHCNDERLHIAQDDWKNFGHNRTLALHGAMKRFPSDYYLIVDADMTVNFYPNWRRDLDTAGDYCMVAYTGALFYRQAMLVSDVPGWRYAGVTHEALVNDSDLRLHRRNFDSITLTHHADGGCRADKFTRDLQLLQDALKIEPDNARYWFYLARTYQDMHRVAEAIGAYTKRISCGGWEEEIYYSKLMIAVLLDNPVYYKEAAVYRPTRCEALYHCGVHYMGKQQWLDAYAMFLCAATLPLPDDVLFVRRDFTEWRIMEQLAIVTRKLGKKTDSDVFFDNLIHKNRSVPTADIDRIMALRDAAP